MQRLTGTDLQVFIKDFNEQIGGNVPDIVRLYALGAEVLIHLIGKEWVWNNVFGKAPLDSFLRYNSKIREDGFKHAHRVVSIAEMLFHFQGIEGSEKRVADIESSSVEDTVGELEGAALLYRSNIPFQFVIPKGHRGEDFDVKAFATDGTSINCEMKTKPDETVLSPETVWNTLNNNRDQLPKGQPGIMFMKIPETWVSQPEITHIISSALDRFFRGTNRVAAVILHWEEWLFTQIGPAMRVAKFRRELNPKSSYRNLVAAEIFDKFSSIATNDNWKYFAGLL